MRYLTALIRDQYCKGRYIGYFRHRIQVFYAHELRSLAGLYGFLQKGVGTIALLGNSFKTVTPQLCLERLNLPPPDLAFTNARKMFTLLAGSLSLTAGLCVLLTSSAMALPMGSQSVTGEVQFSSNGTVLNVSTQSTRAIANYQTFNIANGETVNFNLPSAKSAILNRVTGGSPSEIYGAMNSNGRVFLVNPGGILFGQSSQVNVGSLYASTLNISDEDFLKNRMVFKQETGATPASVINQGNIQVQPHGFAVLSGGAVQNSGTLSAPLGQIEMAVGQQVTVDMGDNLGIDITVDQALAQKVDGLRDAISNTGTLDAAGGSVRMQADLENLVYERSINNEGIISAKGFENNQGTIILSVNTGADSLVRNAGTLDVSGTPDTPDAGQVHLEGDYVVQRGSVLAEGNENGHGGVIQIQSAKGTLLTAESMTSAKGAGEDASGGTVKVLSDGDTYFDSGAVLDISGGALNGDGGFLEVSGKETVNFYGDARGDAPHGLAGTLLIDPTNITIANTPTPTAVSGNNSGTTPDESFTDHAGSSVTFSPQALSSFNTFTDIYLQATNDITISSAFDTSTAAANNLATAVNLKLEANNNINVNAAVTTHNGATIDLLANVDGIGGGGITSNASGTLTSNNGNITLSGSTVTLGAAVNAGTGTVSVTTLSGSNGNIATAANISGGNISLKADGSGSITRTGGTLSAASISLSSTSGSIGAAAAILRTTAGTLTANTGGSGNVYLSETDAVTLADSSAGGTFQLATASNGGITLNGNVSGNTALTLTANGTGAISATSGQLSGATISLSSGTGNIGTAGSLLRTSANTLTAKTGTSANVYLSETDDVTLGVSSAGGTFQLATGNNGNITMAGNITGTATLNLIAQGSGQISVSSGTLIGGTILLSSSSGNIGTSANNIRTTAGTLAANTGGTGNVFISETDAVTLNSSSAGTTFQVTAGNSITMAAPVSASNISLVTSGGNGSINLNDNLTGTSAVTLMTNGTGNVVVASGKSLTSTGGMITVTANNLDLSGNISTGTGTVILAPNGNKSVSLGATTTGTGTFDVDATELTHISAATLTLGNISRTGSMLVQGDLDLSSASGLNYNLSLINGGNITSSNHLFNLGLQTLDFTSALDITLNTLADSRTLLFTSATGRNLSMVTTGLSSPIEVTGNITASGNLQLQTSYSDITVNGAVNSNGLSATSTTLLAGNLNNTSVLSVIGGLNIAQDTNKNLTVVTGTGNIYSDAFFTHDYTFKNFNLQTKGTSAPISITGNINASGNLILETNSGDITINGDINSTGGSGTAVTLEAGNSNSTSAFNLTGTLNMVQDANKSLTLLTSQGNILNQDYFQHDMTFNGISIDTKGANMPISLGGNVTGQNVSLITEASGSPVTINGNLTASSSLTLETASSNIHILGDLTSTGGANTAVTVLAGYNTFNNVLTLDGTLSITGDAAKDLTMTTGTGNIYTNSYFTGSLLFRDIYLASYGDNTGITLGQNITGRDVTLYTYGHGSNISVGNDVNSSRTLALRTGYGDLSVGEDINSTGLANTAAYIAVGENNIPSGVSNPLDNPFTHTNPASFTLGRDFNIAQDATKDFTVIIGTGNVFTKTYFNNALAFRDITLSTGGGSIPITLVGNISGRNVSLTTDGLSSAISVTGDITASQNLTLQTGQSSIIINGNITSNGGAATTTTLIAGLNSSFSSFNVSGLLTIAQDPAKNLSISTGTGDIYGQDFFSHDLHFATLSLATKGTSMPMTLGGNVTGTDVSITTSEINSPITIAGNVTASGNLTLRTAAGNILVSGDINSTGTAGIATTLIAGANNSTGDFTATGLLNIMTDAAKDLTLSTGTGNLFTKAFFNQDLDFQNVTLVSKGNAAPIFLGGDLRAQSVMITTSGLASGISQGLGKTIFSDSLMLGTQSGNIGSATQMLNTSVSSLVIATRGSAYIHEADGIRINNSSASGTFQLANTLGDISLGGNISAGVINLKSMTGSIINKPGFVSTLKASKGMNLTAGNSIGSVNGAIKTWVKRGTLSLKALSSRNGISIYLRNATSKTNTVKLLNKPPGKVVLKPF